MHVSRNLEKISQDVFYVEMEWELCCQIILNNYYNDKGSELKQELKKGNPTDWNPE